MWEALLQQHSPQVLGASPSPCFACGRRDVKLLRNPRAGDRRPSRRRIAVAAYGGLDVTSVQALADATASLQSGAMAARRLGNAWGGMHEAVHSLTRYGGILPVRAEESEKLESEDASFVAEEESVDLGEGEDAGGVAEEAVEAGVSGEGAEGYARESAEAGGSGEGTEGYAGESAGGSGQGAQGYVGESAEAGQSGEGGESVDVGESGEGGGGYAAKSVDDSFADSQPASDAGGVAGEPVEAEGSGGGVYGGESVDVGESGKGGGGYGGEPVDVGENGEGGGGYAGQSVDDTVGDSQPANDGTVGGESVTDGVVQPGADGIVGGESVTDGVGQPGADGIVGGEFVTDGVGQPGADGIVGGESVTDAGSQGDGFGGGLDSLSVEKPRRLELDYNELVRGSGSGGSDQDGGNYDPLGTINDAISGVQDAVANSVASVQKFFQDAIVGITKPSESGGVGSDQGADEAAQTGLGVDQSGGEAVVQSSSGSGSGNPVQDAIDSAQNFLQERVRDVEQAVQNVADGVTGSIQNAVSSVTGAADNVRLDIQTSVDNTTAATQQKLFDSFGVFYPGTSANNTLKVVVDGVKDILGAALVTAEGYAVDVYSFTKGGLPQETQDALSNIEGTILEYSKPVVSSVEQGFEVVLWVVKTVGIDVDNPIVPSIAVGIPAVYFGISWWIQRYGSYSGDLDPRTALQLLKKERNVALIDIRPQEVRDAEGILDLRRGARFKDGFVEMIKVSSAVRKLVRSPRDIDNVVTAAVIRNLKIVNANSKLILLDADGRQTKDLAMTLRKLGVVKQYRIEGGFKAWVSAGLPIKREGPLTPMAILKEETEAIVEEVKPMLEEVKPTTGGVALVALGLVAGVYAISQYEKTLQLIGFLAVCQLLFDKLNSYRTVEDVKKDLRFLGLPFVAGFKLVSSVASRIVPPKLQLATTPSTSAVKEKVLQAAAKHGPNAPETEQPPKGSSPARKPPSRKPAGEGKSADR